MYDIPGSQEWQLYTDSHSDCYICDRRIYTLFLWSPTCEMPIGIKNLKLTRKEFQVIADCISIGGAKLRNNKRMLRRELHEDLNKGQPLIAPT